MCQNVLPKSKNAKNEYNIENVFTSCKCAHFMDNKDYYHYYEVERQIQVKHKIVSLSYLQGY